MQYDTWTPFKTILTPLLRSLIFSWYSLIHHLYLYWVVLCVQRRRSSKNHLRTYTIGDGEYFFAIFYLHSICPCEYSGAVHTYSFIYISPLDTLSLMTTHIYASLICLSFNHALSFILFFIHNTVQQARWILLLHISIMSVCIYNLYLDASMVVERIKYKFWKIPLR